MDLQLALLANAALLVAMVVSVLRFAYAGITAADHRGPRLMATLTSLITLLAACLIYSGEFRRVADDAVARWDRPDVLEQVESITASADDLFVRLADWIAVGTEVGERPHPALWAAYLLGAAYVLRFLIYTAVFRRRLSDANVTGSVIWSHITGYVMVIAFAIIVPNWPISIVLTAAGVALLATATVLTGIFGDAVTLVAGYLRFAFGALLALAQEVARAAVWFAGVVKTVLQHAKAWYADHVSARVRGHAKRVSMRSDDLRSAAARHLAEQNRNHQVRFGKQKNADPAPEPQDQQHEG